VLAVSWPERGTPWALRPVLMGVGSGEMFGISSIGFRGAILAIPDAGFASAASLMLVLSMSVQTLMLCAWLRIAYPGTLTAVLAAWRPSLLTGALAAAASLCWFLAFALESAARVRTLALVELIFAHLLSRRLISQGISQRERLGLSAARDRRGDRAFDGVAGRDPLRFTLGRLLARSINAPPFRPTHHCLRQRPCRWIS